MQNKPLFIGLAAGILILVVAAASFSAGLYFGQRGYVADLQPQQQTGFQPGQGGQFPQNGQPSQNGQQPQGGLPQGNAPQSGPGAGAPSQGGLNPAGGPPGAPSWPPDVMGRLVSITATQLVIDTPNGQVTVTLDSSTQFLNQDGGSAIIGDFQVGDVVAVFGSGTATSIMELPPRPNGQGAPTPTTP